ncbi:cation/H+ exchanger 4 [Hibiscus trionum]|uniref:Cation/H+ exchanger 4 n=1 Tax=Hibiscus trionum TaxID=183268 RepID=A0A9W7HBP3_HIBTR|nr:cation/H+ exchanger 4 [Hibiscus trionum]
MAEAPPQLHPLPHGIETAEVCITLPPMVNSAGIWEKSTSPSEILTYSLPLLEIQMLLIFSVTHLVYAILKPLGVTFFASQMFAGMILGPAILGKVEGFHETLFAQESGMRIVDTVAMFGFAVFLFLMGVKMDLKMAFRTTRRAIVIGFLSLSSPFVVGLIVYVAYKLPNESSHVTTERLMGITVESFTPFAVVACLLGELKIVNSELGRLALSSAAISDLSGLVLVHCINYSKFWTTVSPSFAVWQAVIMVLFVLVLFFVFRPLMFWIIKRTPKGRPIKEAHLVFVMLLALLSCMFTHWHAQTPLLGAFLFGFAVPDGPPLGSALVDMFECFINGVFLAVYVTTSTMRVKPNTVLADPSTLKFSVIYSVLAFLAKFISCSIASFWGMKSWRDTLAFALIMSSKGVVELSYFSTFRDIKILSEATFSTLTLGVLVNATIIPILVKYLYDPVSGKYAGHQNRSLMHLKPDSELRILACIHTHEHVPALIDVLDITCPTKESPNVVHALHLIELAGRDSPVFIAHHENRAADSFENIVAFNHYEQNNQGLVTVNAFTAISPPKLMHEDICNMVLNKQISFILLPFHKKWSIDGSIEAENTVIRNLNCNILDRAPCSIGILVDRRREPSLRRSSSYSIGMLFLGGKDDREALTLAKRMARDPRVKLTVIHFIADEECGNVMDWDMMLDAETLKDAKYNGVSNVCNIMYKEVVSNNGPQAAKIVKSIADDYDLIIVGRHNGEDWVQTTGLSEWSEFPELGVIGDLFASPDFESRASLLVVQHFVDVDRH